MQSQQAQDLAVTTWQTILATLHQRGLLKERPQQGGYVVPFVKVTLVLPRTIAFVLDMQRLGGISAEIWTDARLSQQLSAALEGRQAQVIHAGGLALVVEHRPSRERSDPLPERVLLDVGALPEEPYRVRLGLSRYGPIDLDLGGAHRAILVGGTSGAGKTNLFQSFVLQLTARHGPEALRIAVADLKEVDFGPQTPFAQLPHLLLPVAYSEEEAHVLLERVWAQHIARKQRFQGAGVASLENYNARGGHSFPRIVLFVDEIADLAGTEAMETLVQIARKGRATGISVVAGTQHPTTKVIDSQVKANLPLRIAFQTATASDSRTILGRGGAETLRQRGRCLLFIGGHWRVVQTLLVSSPEALVDDHVVALSEPLEDVERDLVRVALEELEGAFNINRLYHHPVNQNGGGGYRISKRALTSLAQTWEQRGWLTSSNDVTSPRYVTATLRALV
jgi:hypothetical protein